MPNLADLYHQHFNDLQQRYDNLLAKCNFDVLQVYSGQTPKAFLDDQHYSFKTNPHFKALLPALDDYAQSWIVYQIGQRPALYLYLPDDYWHSYPALSADIWTDYFDINVVTQMQDMPSLIHRDGRVATIGEFTSQHDSWNLGEINPESLMHHLHWHRACKSHFEIECIAEANRIAAKAHIAAQQAFEKGESEYGIHIAYCKVAKQDGPKLPYENLISINKNGSILHYSTRGHDVTEERLSFLIDAGATYRGYCSDITRTYAMYGGVFADLIRAMDRLQLSIVGQVRAGDEYLELHKRCHRGICGLLSAFNIVNCDAETAFKEGLSEVFFPHGLGHFLGLQVHDIGGQQANEEGGTLPPPAEYPALRTTRRLEAGQVLTIEPGIYFIDSLLNALKESPRGELINWALVDELKPFGGIRIEDDVVVSAAGEPRNLTREAFEQLA